MSRDEGQPTDAELLSRMREGEADAFQALFDRYRPAVRARLRGRIPIVLRRKIDPEDILQEAYLTALGRMEEFAPRHERSFGRWLAQIVEFKVREAVRFHLDRSKRSATREVSRGGRPDTSAFAARGPSPSVLAMSTEERRAAQEALAGLSSDHRRVLELVLFEGLSLRESAERIERSYEATKKLYARALRAFKTRFAARGRHAD